MAGVLRWELPPTYRQLSESVSAPVAVEVALGFALANGAIEDSIFFGVLPTPLLRYSPPVVAVSLTAIAFGVAHFNGAPNGLIGILLAAWWVLMLGYMGIRTQGMLATYLPHIVADVTIVIVLIRPLIHGRGVNVSTMWGSAFSRGISVSEPVPTALESPHLPPSRRGTYTPSEAAAETAACSRWSYR